MHLEAGEEGLADVILVGEGGEGDCGEVTGEAAALADLADEVVAVLEGHGDVAEKDFGVDGFDELQGFDDGAGDGDQRTGIAEDFGKEIAGVGFIIDDEDAEAIKAEGRTFSSGSGA
jgi:hypothetical protein